MSAPAPKTRIFRLPRLAYLVVVLLAFGCAPLAFTAHGYESESASLGPQTLIMLIPVIAAVFVARTATIVDTHGITVRAALGARQLSWDDVRGLSVDGSRVYAVVDDGAVRLPCVGIADLAEVARASGGRLPPIADPTPKYAPQRRRRR